MQAEMPEFENRDRDPATKLRKVSAFVVQLLR